MTVEPGTSRLTVVVCSAGPGLRQRNLSGLESPWWQGQALTIVKDNHTSLIKLRQVCAERATA